jgi:hypothetical protein
MPITPQPQLCTVEELYSHKEDMVPYYRENFLNSFAPISYVRDGVVERSGAIALESVEMTSYRTRPHPMAFASKEVLDITADPYAYFLESTSRKKYHDRMRERGLQPEGSPDRGHSFLLKRHTLELPRYDLTQLYKPSTPDRLYNWQGANVAVYPATGTLSHVHDGELNDLGPASYKETGLDAFAQQAYSRTAPTSVIFDAAVFLGELREGLPSFTTAALKNSIGFFRGLGKDYLNVEFGWKPFLADITNAANALARATKELSQQGQRVHRRYGLPAFIEVDMHSGSGSVNVSLSGRAGFASADGIRHPALGSDSLTTTSAGLGNYQLYKKRRVNRWFEGEFSSFYPLDFDPESFYSRWNALVNTKITPRVLWELAPWSWLIDWSLRIGDSIASNEMAANDLLVMHYGYAMEEAAYSSDLDWYMTTPPGTGTSVWGGLPSRGKVRAITTYKRRLRANPYGFTSGGAGSLRGNQLAILGALGLTKVR